MTKNRRFSENNEEKYIQNCKSPTKCSCPVLMNLIMNIQNYYILPISLLNVSDYILFIWTKTFSSYEGCKNMANLDAQALCSEHNNTHIQNYLYAIV